MNNCLVFDIWGEYGHFKKFYTTSSPLSFSFPSRTAVIGIVAAILGIDKREYIKFFPKEETYIGIKIMNPIKKIRMGLNLIDTKKAKEFMSKIHGRTQINMELIKDAKFRIYFSHKNPEIYQKLKYMLERHYTTYTLCLGLSECIANYEYIDELPVKKITDKNVKISSIIPYNEELKLNFEAGLAYYKEVVPNDMNTEREVLEYIKILFEKNGKGIRCNPKECWQVGDEDYVLFL
ncbi:MAG: type I-B CRISPR-associated protein Cas5b [Marinisporobacter sp.]|jgi:CRISPR-associated protein Cas5h|nr:type I-B CRISPR-associated protein Cas5b [Marinisporobacter sp.]